MKEILWIYSTSAAGKETFIKSLLKDADLRKALLPGKSNIAISEESLRSLGKLDNSRKAVVDEVLALAVLNDIIIIKWQYGDTLLNTPNLLLEALPDFRHRVIKLQVSREAQVKRLRTKSWWHDIGDESEFIEKETKLVEESIQQLNSAFVIERYDW